MNRIELLLTFLLFSVFSFGQSDSVNQSYDPGEFKEKINEWNSKHFKSATPPLKEESIVEPSSGSGQVDRVRHACHDEKFLLGANIAWNIFHYDLSLANYDASYFEAMFTDVEAQGGNSMRFWLHTNGGKNPLFEDISDPLKCTGIAASDTTNLKDLLDRAWNHGIAIQICLWTHNMLSTQQAEVTQAVRNRNRAILENPIYTQYYIDNALMPVLKATGNHPALLAYEIFNEPEGMSTGVTHNPTLGNWPDFEHTNFKNIQTTINLISGAIHRELPNALVTNGALDVESTTDVDGHVNYYLDDSLINRGGDPDGYLDFYTVHYYNWAGQDHSPFHHSVDYWELDKPLVIAEFYAEETFGVPADSLFKKLYDDGYAGAWGWQYFYNGSRDLWGEMELGIKIAHDNYASDIDWDDKVCTDLNAVFEVDKKITCKGVDIVFTDLSTNSPTSWYWNFGVDATPTEAFTQGPHTVSYSSEGRKTISLTVNQDANSDTETLTDYITTNPSHEIILTASDNTICDGTNIIFTTDITPIISGSSDVTSIPLGAWGENVTTIQSYDLNYDGTTSPSLSNLSRFLHGTGKPTFGTYVEFTGSFSSTSQASIYSKATSGAQSVEIFIDGNSEGVFAMNGIQNHSVNVPEGTHTIRFEGVGNDWISVEKYVFTDIKEEITYEWFLNNSPLPSESSNSYASSLLNDEDEISVSASSQGFNCAVPTINSNVIKMNCLPTSINGDLESELFKVFPNPSSYNFTINSEKEFAAQIFDGSGKLIETINVQGDVPYNFGANLPAGIYLIVDLSSAKSVRVIKL